MTDRCPRCGRFMGNRKVGLGPSRAWICLACFDRAMAGIGREMAKFRHMFWNHRPVSGRHEESS